MRFIALLRALFPWYGVIATGVIAFALTEWLGRSTLGSSWQSVSGAVCGIVVALGFLMKLHEAHHRDEVWRPAEPRNLSKAAKTAGVLAGVSGAIDTVLRSNHSHYQWITVMTAACLAAAAAALARMAKMNPAEESTSWKQSV
jgi:hypothetical protein